MSTTQAIAARANPRPQQDAHVAGAVMGVDGSKLDVADVRGPHGMGADAPEEGVRVCAAVLDEVTGAGDIVAGEAAFQKPIDLRIIQPIDIGSADVRGIQQEHLNLVVFPAGGGRQQHHVSMRMGIKALRM